VRAGAAEGVEAIVAAGVAEDANWFGRKKDISGRIKRALLDLGKVEPIT
jgi:hypothetical protein